MEKKSLKVLNYIVNCITMNTNTSYGLCIFIVAGNLKGALLEGNPYPFIFLQCAIETRNREDEVIGTTVLRSGDL